MLVGATNDRLTTIADGMLVRPRPPDSRTAAALTDLAADQLGARRIGVLRASDAFGTGSAATSASGGVVYSPTSTPWHAGPNRRTVPPTGHDPVDGALRVVGRGLSGCRAAFRAGLAGIAWVVARDTADEVAGVTGSGDRTTVAVEMRGEPTGGPAGRQTRVDRHVRHRRAGRRPGRR